MFGLLKKGGMLYNMTHLDEMQECQEKGESGNQIFELETRDSEKGKKGDEKVVGDEGSEESFVLVEDTTTPSAANESPPIEVPTSAVISSAYSSTKEDKGHRLGNFWNYPEFNPSSKRLEVLPEILFALVASTVKPGAPLRYADLGCNEGELTLAFFQRLVAVLDGGNGEVDPLAEPKDVKSLGVDIDEVLIERARARALAGDLASGTTSIFSPPSPSIIFVPGNITDKTFLQSQVEHISVRGKRLTLISLFSTTMWIHIHLGDEKFFKFLESVCEQCEFFLIEPQPRKCYKNVNKRLRSIGRPPVDFAGLENLLQIEDNIENCILKCGFSKVDLWGEGEDGQENRTHWERKLMLFQRL